MRIDFDDGECIDAPIGEIFDMNRKEKKIVEEELIKWAEKCGYHWRIKHVRHPTQKEEKEGKNIYSKNTDQEVGLVRIRKRKLFKLDMKCTVFGAQIPRDVKRKSVENKIIEFDRVQVEPAFLNEGTIARLEDENNYEVCLGVSKCFEKSFDRLTGRVIAMARCKENLDRDDEDGKKRNSKMDKSGRTE